MRGSYLELVQQPNAAEALSWFRETSDPESRTISGDDSETAWLRDEALSIVQEIYGPGAVCITAVEIAGRTENAEHQDTDALIIELPDDTAERRSLFAWAAGFARGTGWGPQADTRQKHLLVRRD